MPLTLFVDYESEIHSSTSEQDKTVKLKLRFCGTVAKECESLERWKILLVRLKWGYFLLDHL